MAQIQEFKCPSCGGKLEFDAQSQKMVCPFCGSVYEPNAIPDANVSGEEAPAHAPQDEPQWERTDNDWTPDETGAMQIFVCRSCGGELLTEETTAATSCPYCGNPVVLSGRLSGTLKPDYVIPFKITADEAKAELKKFVNSQRFASRKFKSENRLKEIKGVYVPFWLFDSDVFATAEFSAKKVNHWSDHTYDYTETEYYDMSRTGEMRFENVPVDASKKMPDSLRESLEPFMFHKAVPFRTAYLSGFLADKYDVDMQESMQRATERTKASAMGALRSTVSGYTSVSADQSEVQIRPGRSKYVLCPVWLLNTQYLGTKYTFAMNGQTGKFIGSLPISKGKLAWLFGAVSVGVSGALFALGFLIGLY